MGSLMQPETPRRRPTAFFVSLLLHALAIALWVWRPAALFVQPTEMAEGLGGRSAQVVYAGPMIADFQLPSPHIVLTSSERGRLTAPESKHRRVTRTEGNRSTDRSKLAGSLLGTALDGFQHDLRPALPTVFPDPPVSSDDLPAGAQGDVIVEITIDQYGNVVGERLLQGIDHDGLERKVMTTLQSWHFKPATRDGAAIASQQDVHFHFPS